MSIRSRKTRRIRLMGYDGSVASERWWGAASILLALLTVLVFVPGLSDEFTWDDNGLIRTNENIQQPERYVEALTTHFWNVSSQSAQANETYNHLYRPLVTFAYIVQYRLFSLHASGYRAVSLALHVLCCFLAFFWLRRRLPPADEGHQLVAVCLGAAVFAFHPSRVEAVSWISGSTELWMCLLVLLGALAFDSNRNWLAGVLLAVALFAKETSIVAAPLLLADRYLSQGRRERSASIALTAPVVVALLARVWIVDVEFPFGEIRGATTRVLSSFGLYAQQILAPWNPTAFPGMRVYECSGGEALQVAWWLGGTLVFIALLVPGILAFRKRAWRPVLADALWVVVPLLPVANLIDLGSRNLTADRFLYLPLLGTASLLARGLLWMFENRASLGKTVAIVSSVVVLGFAVVTSLHSRVFASSASLWEYEVKRNPDNPFALHAVGTARTRAGLRGSALAYLEHAHDVVARSCVRDDQLRASKDLAWALSLRTRPEQRATLLALQSTYDRIHRDGVFEYRESPSWLLELTPAEAADFVAEDLQYALPRATVEARLGQLDAAMQILWDQAGPSDSLHPLSQSLRIRLVAAQGHVGQALLQLAQESEIPDKDSLGSVLATLRETLSGTELPSSAEASLAQYALGFGQPPRALDRLRPESRAVLDALRSYETGSPVDLASLERQRANSDELSRFMQLAKAKADVRRLDGELLTLGR